MFSLKLFLVVAIALVVVAQAFAYPGDQHGPEGELIRGKKDVFLGYGGYRSYYPYYRGLYSSYYY